MTPEIWTAIIGGIVAIATAYIERRARRSRLDRADEIREWRYSTLNPLVLEWWSQPGMPSSPDARVDLVCRKAETLAYHDSNSVIRRLPPRTIHNMAQAALGTIPGVGFSGDRTVGGF